MDVLVESILEGSRTNVLSMVRQEPGLARAEFRDAQLYEQLAHWIYEGDTYLHLAAAAYRTRIVETLLTAGADPDASGRRGGTPLHYAADGYRDCDNWNPREQVRTIRALVNAGADLAAQDSNGATPLHRAVRTRCAEAVRALLTAGSDPAARNRAGSTALHLAVQTTGRGGSGTDAAHAAQRIIIRALLDHGANVRLTDGKGRTVKKCIQANWVREIFDA